MMLFFSFGMIKMNIYAEKKGKKMSYDFENKKINANVRTGELFQIHGMQDYYLGVTFRYHAKNLEWMRAYKIKISGDRYTTYI